MSDPSFTNAVLRREGYKQAIHEIKETGLAMMMHAVGDLKSHNRRTKEPYRNHYCSVPERALVWDALVGLGLAYVINAPSQLTGGATTYGVTTSGIDFLWAITKKA